MNEEQNSRIFRTYCIVGCGTFFLATKDTWEEEKQAASDRGWTRECLPTSIVMAQQEGLYHDYTCPKCALQILQTALESIADQIQKQQEKIHKTETEALAAEPAPTG